MSSTAWLNNDNSVIQYFDSTGKVAINNSSPAYRLDVNGSIRTNDMLYSSNITNTNNISAGGRLYLNNKLENNRIVLYGNINGATNDTTHYGFGCTAGFLRYQVPTDGAHSFYNSSTELARFAVDKTIISKNVELSGSLSLVNNGETNSINIAGGHIFTTYPMIMNAGQGKFLVRSNGIDQMTMIGPNMNVVGSVTAAGYCNVTVDSFTNNSIHNAPTCSALSNVYAMNTWPSNNSVLGLNTAVWSSNVAVSASNKAYSLTWSSTPNKLIKSLDTSNALSITVNWQTPSTNNAYYIMLDVSQNIASQTACGIRRKRVAISTSNWGIAYDQMADTFGNYSAFSTLQLAVTASNSTSCTLTSSTNWVTTGTMAHVYSAEILGAPLQIGNITLS